MSKTRLGNAEITYFHAMHALWPDWDEAGRKARVTANFGPLIDEDDVETRQLYLDLFADTLSFTEKQTIIDRILKDSKKLSDRLHYKRQSSCLISCDRR